ncbi:MULTISPECIES: cyclophilin-like fold protein [unclassified Arcobacter]|uniref:cyclophilin-like fold protein n=1 Tax=Arcobacter TaxID=28196 RepID=UPI0035D41533
MKQKLLIIFSLLLFLQSFMTITANEIKQKDKDMGNKITITIGQKEFVATLEENETVKELKKRLPLSITMNDLHSNEKYYHFSKALPTDSYSPKFINAGDIMLYDNYSLVLFYKTFSTPYRYTKIGHIDDTHSLEETLGSEDIAITFDLK